LAWYEKLYTKDYLKLCGFASPKQSKIKAKFVAEVLKLNPDSKLLAPAAAADDILLGKYSLP